MKITKITKRLGRTITNKVTYSSVTLHSELEAVLEPGETLEEAEERLYHMVAESLTTDIERMRKAKEDAKKENKEQTTP